MAEEPVASSMAGASMSGSSPVDAGLNKATTGLGKIVTQLRQVESLMTSIGRKSGSIGPKSGGVSSGGSMMSTSLAQFSTPPPGGDGNIMAGSTPRFSGGGVGGNMMAAGAYALGAAYAMVPTVDQAVDRQTALHLGSMANPGSYNTGRLNTVVRASFGGNVSGVNSDVSAALALSRTGMDPTSVGGRSIMRTAGVAYQTLGMSNTSAALAANNFYSGAQGSQLFQYGIRTRDNSGNPVSQTSIVNQLYKTLYAGHKNPTDAQIGMDYQAGFLGQSLNQLGMSDDQKQIVLQGLRAKAESTRTGKSFSMEDVPGAASNKDTNPLLGMGEKNQSINTNISASMAGLVDGFNAANSTLTALNNKMAEVVTSMGQMAQDLLKADAYIRTMAGDNQGSGVMQGLGGVGSALIGAMGARGGMSALRGAAGGGGAGASLRGALGAGGAPAWLSKGIPVGGMAMLGRGALGAGTYYGLDKLEEFLNTRGGADKDSGWLRKGGATISRILFDAGKGGAAGVATAGPLGGVIGSILGLGQGAYNAISGQGWDYGDKGNVGSNLPSYAVGSYDLPSDHVAQVHKGEMILPASIAAAVRKNIAGGQSGGGSTPVHIHLTMSGTSDAEVLRVGRQLKSIIENPSMATSVKEK